MTTYAIRRSCYNNCAGTNDPYERESLVTENPLAEETLQNLKQVDYCCGGKTQPDVIDVHVFTLEDDGTEFHDMQLSMPAQNQYQVFVDLSHDWEEGDIEVYDFIVDADNHEKAEERAEAQIQMGKHKDVIKGREYYIWMVSEVDKIKSTEEEKEELLKKIADQEQSFQERVLAVKQAEQNMLKEHGWYVHYIFETDQREYDGMANIHTHGLKENFDHAELQLVMPLEPGTAQLILNSLFQEIKNGKRFEAGVVYENIFTLPVSFANFTEDGRDVLRILIPDPQGKLPDQDDCEAMYKRQLEQLADEKHPLH